AKWIDHNVYPQNLVELANPPTGNGTEALDQPGFKHITLKAIDILQECSKANDSGWFMMRQASTRLDLDMMHILDYYHALSKLLELDDTIKATIQHESDDIGKYESTLIVVTANHGHGL
ncbi:hypothetical protein ARMSODRAFT_847775, partial [Armillaria solidipes]